MNAQSETKNTFRVAIVGAGIAGLTLLKALETHPHIDAQLYEARAELSTTGAAIALQENATASLAAISPALLGVLNAAGAVHSKARSWVACGPHAEQQVVMRGQIGIHNEHARFFNVGRGAFVAELGRTLPAARVHMGKKLERLDRTEQGVWRLGFGDGTSAHADLVVGADGIHSRIRARVLGDKHPAVKPNYAGWWYHVALLPVETLQKVLGKELVNPDDPYSQSWIGERGTCIDHSFVNGGKQVQCGFTVRGDGDYDPATTSSQIHREQVLNEYRNWPKKFGVDLINMVFDHSGDPLHCWPLSQHSAAPTFVKDDLVVMGDAAHGSTPWQGSGASMAIEDAMVLATVLGQVKANTDVPAALKAFSELRQPRCQRVVEASYEAGMLMTGRNAFAGLDKDKIADQLGVSGDFIGAFDPQEHCAEAVKLMTIHQKAGEIRD